MCNSDVMHVGTVGGKPCRQRGDVCVTILPSLHLILDISAPIILAYKEYWFHFLSSMICTFCNYISCFSSTRLCARLSYFIANVSSAAYIQHNESNVAFHMQMIQKCGMFVHLLHRNHTSLFKEHFVCHLMSDRADLHFKGTCSALVQMVW